MIQHNNATIQLITVTLYTPLPQHLILLFLSIISDAYHLLCGSRATRLLNDWTC